VPATIYADEKLLAQIRHDQPLEKAANTGETKRSGGTIDLHDGAAPAVRALRAREFPLDTEPAIGD
jgi:hypothetical protein